MLAHVFRGFRGCGRVAWVSAGGLANWQRANLTCMPSRQTACFARCVVTPPRLSGSRGRRADDKTPESAILKLPMMMNSRCLTRIHDPSNVPPLSIFGLNFFSCYFPLFSFNPNKIAFSIGV